MMKMENEINVTVPLEVVKASEIEPKEVKWLWYPYIPFGKVTLLQGDPGDGKSKLMLSIAALLSKGEPLPFTEEETEPMTVIYQTTEDDGNVQGDRRYSNGGYAQAPCAGGPLPQRCFEAIGNAKGNGGFSFRTSRACPQ